MKLLIKEHAKTRLAVWLPNILLKNRLLIHFLVKKADVSGEDIKQIQKYIKTAYHALKRHITAYGHFTLFEVYSTDGLCVSMVI